MKNILNIKALWLKFLGLIIALFIPLIVFSSILNVMQFRGTVCEVYVNANNLNATGAVQKIDYSLNFGKSINKFYGLDKILESTKSLSEDIVGVAVTDSENKIVKSVGNNIKEFPSGLSDSPYVEQDNIIYSKVGLSENSYIILALKSDYVNSMSSNYISSVVRVDLLILLGVILITLAVYFLILRIKKTISINILTVTGVLILVFSQMFFGAYMSTNYINEYTNSLQKISTNISNIIDKDLESIVSYGIPISELNDVDAYLDNIADRVPEIQKITFTETKEDDESGNVISNKIQILDQDYYINIKCQIDQNTINDKLFDLFLSIGILTIVTVLFTLEISVFIGNKMKVSGEVIKNKINIPGIRMFLFLIYMAIFIDSGFVSIVSYRLYQSMKLDGTMNFLTGLPTTASYIAVLLGLFCCSVVISKLGMRNTILLGVILCSLGFILSGLSNTLILFIVARFIIGLGKSAILGCSRIYSTSVTDSESRTKLLSTILAASSIGGSCGIVIGGLIADRTSYSFTFIVGGVLILLISIFIKISDIENTKDIKPLSFSRSFKMLKNSRILMYMLFIIIPIYMAQLFILYSIPLFGDEIGISQSKTSALIMANYLLCGYLSNTSSKYTMKKFGSNRSTMIYCLCIILFVGSFALTNNLVVSIITALLLGISDSFGLTVCSENLSELSDNKENGTELSILLLAIGYVGQIIAPIIISSGINNGIAKATAPIAYIMAAGLSIYIIYSLALKLRSKRQ